MASNIDPSLTKNLKFGVTDDDAPDLGFLFTTEVNLKYEPEVYVKAPDGEGHSVALARSQPKATGTVVGYVSSPEYVMPFSFQYDDLTFICKKASRPQPKGQFMEVTVDVDGFAGLNS